MDELVERDLPFLRPDYERMREWFPHDPDVALSSDLSAILTHVVWPAFVQRVQDGGPEAEVNAISAAVERLATDEGTSDTVMDTVGWQAANLQEPLRAQLLTRLGPATRKQVDALR